MIKLRSLITIGIIAFGLAFLGLILERIAGNPLEVLDRPLHNGLERAGLKENHDIVLIDLDENSTLALGDRTDWPALWLPQVLSQLKQAKIVAVTLPIFEGLSSPLPGKLAEDWIAENQDSIKRWFRMPITWPQEVLIAFYRYADTVGSQKLGETLLDAGNVFYGVKLLDFVYVNPPTAFTLSVPRNPALLRKATDIVQKKDFLEPVSMYHAKGIGYVDVFYNRYGQVREVPLIALVNDKFYPSLAFRMYKELLGESARVDVTPGNMVKVGKRKFRLGNKYAYPIHFTSDLTEYKRYTVGEILTGDVPADSLADKIVFVGSSFDPYSMSVSTSVNGKMPQMVLQANLLTNLMNNEMATPASLVISFVITLIFSALAAFAVMLPWRKFTLPGLVVLLGILFAVVATTSINSGTRISFFTPLAASVISLVVAYFVYEKQEGARNRYIKQLVHNYIPAEQEDEYFARFMDLPYLKIDRNGVIMAVYLLFKKQEKSLQEAHVSFEEFRRQILNIARKYGGIRLSFIGNSCLFLFTGDNAGNKACKASLEVRRFFTNFDAKYKTEGIGEFRIGIGLAEGETLISTLGDVPLVDFSVFGSAVVWARQLALLNFEQKTKILITDRIIPHLPSEAKVIELGELEIVEEKQVIYEYRH
ncbi:CHASE2 domain-containing protein [candidate division WOR-3 bacterium]|uniref:CHASE2 domain-containing protein n=1 Tax=candidate division WOR-3 bacterium TaxID=2052148 RepID=A0A9D5K8L4_UNCW3|nr:CHASE2 domain-containing protein [candidate division WOR-3 bacterium]MBD3364351.1 CHASE2 domain-containing protein [candidate division WOR-3 bacterium]